MMPKSLRHGIQVTLYFMMIWCGLVVLGFGWTQKPIEIFDSLSKESDAEIHKAVSDPHDQVWWNALNQQAQLSLNILLDPNVGGDYDYGGPGGGGGAGLGGQEDDPPCDAQDVDRDGDHDDCDARKDDDDNGGGGGGGKAAGGSGGGGGGNTGAFDYGCPVEPDEVELEVGLYTGEYKTSITTVQPFLIRNGQMIPNNYTIPNIAPEANFRGILTGKGMTNEHPPRGIERYANLELKWLNRSPDFKIYHYEDLLVFNDDNKKEAVLDFGAFTSCNPITVIEEYSIEVEPTKAGQVILEGTLKPQAHVGGQGEDSNTVLATVNVFSMEVFDPQVEGDLPAAVYLLNGADDPYQLEVKFKGPAGVDLGYWKLELIYDGVIDVYSSPDCLPEDLIEEGSWYGAASDQIFYIKGVEGNTYNSSTLFELKYKPDLDDDRSVEENISFVTAHFEYLAMHNPVDPDARLEFRAQNLEDMDQYGCQAEDMIVPIWMTNVSEGSPYPAEATFMVEVSAGSGFINDDQGNNGIEIETEDSYARFSLHTDAFYNYPTLDIQAKLTKFSDEDGQEYWGEISDLKLGDYVVGPGDLHQVVKAEPNFESTPPDRTTVLEIEVEGQDDHGNPVPGDVYVQVLNNDGDIDPETLELDAEGKGIVKFQVGDYYDEDDPEYDVDLYVGTVKDPVELTIAQRPFSLELILDKSEIYVTREGPESQVVATLQAISSQAGEQAVADGTEIIWSSSSGAPFTGETVFQNDQAQVLFDFYNTIEDISGPPGEEGAVISAKVTENLEARATLICRKDGLSLQSEYGWLAINQSSGGDADVYYELTDSSETLEYPAQDTLIVDAGAEHAFEEVAVSLYRGVRYGHWPLEEFINGNQMADILHPGAYEANIYGGYQLENEERRSGVAALYLDGLSGSFLEIEDQDFYWAGVRTKLNFWLNPQLIPEGGMILSKDEDFSLRYSNGALSFELETDQGTEILTTEESLVFGYWCQIGITIDRQLGKFSLSINQGGVTDYQVGRFAGSFSHTQANPFVFCDGVMATLDDIELLGTQVDGSDLVVMTGLDENQRLTLDADGRASFGVDSLGIGSLEDSQVAGVVVELVEAGLQEDEDDDDYWLGLTTAAIQLYLITAEEVEDLVEEVDDAYDATMDELRHTKGMLKITKNLAMYRFSDEKKRRDFMIDAAGVAGDAARGMEWLQLDYVGVNNLQADARYIRSWTQGKNTPEDDYNFRMRMLARGAGLALVGTGYLFKNRKTIWNSLKGSNAGSIVKRAHQALVQQSRHWMMEMGLRREQVRLAEYGLGYDELGTIDHHLDGFFGTMNTMHSQGHPNYSDFSSNVFNNADSLRSFFRTSSQIDPADDPGRLLRWLMDEYDDYQPHSVTKMMQIMSTAPSGVLDQIRALPEDAQKQVLRGLIYADSRTNGLVTSRLNTLLRNKSLKDVFVDPFDADLNGAPRLLTLLDESLRELDQGLEVTGLDRRIGRINAHIGNPEMAAWVRQMAFDLEVAAEMGDTGFDVLKFVSGKAPADRFAKSMKIADISWQQTLECADDFGTPIHIISRQKATDVFDVSEWPDKVLRRKEVQKILRAMDGYTGRYSDPNAMYIVMESSQEAEKLLDSFESVVTDSYLRGIITRLRNNSRVLGIEEIKDKLPL